jgi:phosphate starvation-inducible PhoH-like protein
MKKIPGTKSRKSREGTQISSIQLSKNQQKYYDSLNSPNISLVVGLGPAGSGKTLLACHSAVLAIQSKSVDKIIITRPLVSVDEELGFLPGTFQAKMDPWVRPIFDILRETFTMAQIQSMIEDGFIEISPLAYMRGRTFKRSFIIADEMQNSSPNQMKMILTRIGEGSKMVITGDLFQSDRLGENGLSDFMLRYNDAPLSDEIACIELGKRDVHRSSIVSTILNIYEPEFTNNYDMDDIVLVKETVQVDDPVKETVQVDDIVKETVQVDDIVKETVQVDDHVKETVQVDDPVDDMVYKQIDDAALIPRKWNKKFW